MAGAAPYALEWRQLTSEDSQWIGRFACGEEWWSHEVTNFLRRRALRDQADGFSSTFLFSFPGFKEIVGFVTAASSSMELEDEVKTATGIRRAPGGRLPAVILPFLGVDRRYRRVGHFGQEIHTWLLRTVSNSVPASRVIYLECWAENDGGLAFWRRMGYVEFKREPTARSDGGGRADLVRLVHDRYAIRAPQG